MPVPFLYLDFRIQNPESGSKSNAFSVVLSLRSKHKIPGNRGQIVKETGIEDRMCYIVPFVFASCCVMVHWMMSVIRWSTVESRLKSQINHPILTSKACRNATFRTSGVLVRCFMHVWCWACLFCLVKNGWTKQHAHAEHKQTPNT